MKINLEINDIDYGALIEIFLPMIHDKLSSADGMVAKLLGKVAGTPPEAAAKIVDMLPQDSKDDIAVYLINSKKDVIISAVQEYAGNKGVSFNIGEFSVET